MAYNGAAPFSYTRPLYGVAPVAPSLGYPTAPIAPVTAPPPQTSAELQRWFSAVDRDHNGTVDVGELSAVLSSAGFPFSLGTTEKLLNMYDTSRDGTVTFNQFAHMHAFLVAMRNGFQQLDTSGDGRLDIGEIRVGLHASGYQLSEHTIHILMGKFDRQKRGSLGFDDYIELSTFLSKARNAYAFYDRQRTGQVIFTLDTFAAAGTSMN